MQRRPALAAAGVAALLAAAVLPFLHGSYGNGDPRTLPRASESRQVALALAARFPGTQADPIQVVVAIPAGHPRIAAYAAAAAPDDRLGADPGQGAGD